MNHPAKRRRLDDGAFTLSKPFRSPLKSSLDRRHNEIKQEKRDDIVQQTPILGQNDEQSTPKTIKSTRSVLPTTSTSTPSGNPSDSEVVYLQRRHAALLQELRSRNQDLDVLRQASNITTNKQKGNLEALIKKWRAIARDAADEIFDSASTRVRDMGGLKAISKNALRGSQNDWYDLKEEQPSSDAYDALVDEVNTDHIQGEYETDTDEFNPGDDDEQHFTMDIMLQQLNIDPDLLEFDTKTDQWLD